MDHQRQPPERGREAEDRVDLRKQNHDRLEYLRYRRRPGDHGRMRRNLHIPSSTAHPAYRMLMTRYTGQLGHLVVRFHCWNMALFNYVNYVAIRHEDHWLVRGMGEEPLRCATAREAVTTARQKARQMAYTIIMGRR